MQTSTNMELNALFIKSQRGLNDTRCVPRLLRPWLLKQREKHIQIYTGKPYRAKTNKL